MKALLVLLVVVCSVSPAAAQVIFAEGFEAGFDGSGWSGGSVTLDTSIKRSGQSAARLDGVTSNEIISYDLGAPMTDTVLEAWFWDGLESTKESFVSISGDPSHLVTSAVHVKVGTTCSYDGGNYTAVDGWHAGGYSLGPARSLGWHKVTIENVQGINHCYIDGQLIHSTSFQGNWRYLILNEDNHCQTGSSWFDDLRVYESNPVPVEAGRWGTLKGIFGE